MIYQLENISVDESFARFGEKSYAINKINSTDIKERAISGARGYYAWFPIAAFLTIVSIAGFLAPDNNGKIGTLIVMAIPTVLCWLLGFRSYDRRHTKYSYELYLSMSNRDQQAVASPNRDELEDLKAAIEQAMVASR